MALVLKGYQQFRARLMRIGGNINKAIGAALYAEGEHVREIGIPMTPLDTGALRGSWYVKPPQRSGSDITVEVGVGGAAAPYALEQHERLDYAHEVGGPMFLSGALAEAEEGYQERLAERIQEAIRRLGRG